MERKLSILMVSAEVHPLAKVGGLADVMGALPRALERRGHDVKIVIPYYGMIKDKGIDAHRAHGMGEMEVALGDSVFKAELWATRLPDSGIDVFLIGNPELFDRKGIYTDPESREVYPDNAERFVFFGRAVLEMMGSMKWHPDVVHCHDHQTGFITAWLRTTDAESPLARRVRTVFTIHNLAYQGSYPLDVGRMAGFGEDVLTPMGGIELNGEINMMKGGINYAETITAVSPTYSKEIQTPEYGYGLEGILSARADDLVGILNGADYSVWNPKTDAMIPARYGPEDRAGKRECRRHLIERLGLQVGEQTPLIGIVSRLVDQKGFDLVDAAFEDIIGLDAAVAVLGLGEQKHHDALTANAERFPGRVSVNLAFDEQLAHQIEAGSDMFLMPSRYEPCGLNQMYSMKYGTIPVVRKTGGLADTVVDFEHSESSTGFVFDEYSPEALLGAIRRARQVFSKGEAWEGLVWRAMVQDFSWDRSAQTYEQVYLATLEKRRVVTAS
jgi:starch synthase